MTKQVKDFVPRYSLPEYIFLGAAWAGVCLFVGTMGYYLFKM